MSKADELALSHCKKCNKRCSTPCSDVLISMFLATHKSIPEIEEMMKNARHRAGI